MGRGERIRCWLGRIVAGIAILPLLPLGLAVMALIRITSPGPALFHQERVGLHGRRFRIHKLRTMRGSASEAGPAITAGSDPRVTVVGRILRRMKIDEVPQLFNVVSGEMAFVGPRPEVPSYVDFYPEDLRRIVLSVRPGMTDIASLTYIDESELLGRATDPERYYVDVLIPQKLKLAVAYVDHRNWWLDLRILVATLTAIFGWHWLPQTTSMQPKVGSSNEDY